MKSWCWGMDTRKSWRDDMLRHTHYLNSSSQNTNKTFDYRTNYTHTHTHLVTNPLSNYICILRKLIAFLQILYFFRLSIINYNYWYIYNECSKLRHSKCNTDEKVKEYNYVMSFTIGVTCVAHFVSPHGCSYRT